MTRDNPRMDAALRYAEHGWPVFPLQPGSKIPLVRSHGFLEASTDDRQVARWFERHPDRNVAIATGKPGPDVLDVDVKGAANGSATLNRLIRADLIGQPQAMLRTPSGGNHLYYAGTDQRNGSLAARHGIDYRGQGGYVATIPSVIGGKSYELIKAQRSADTCDWEAIANHLEPERTRERQPWSPPEGQQGVGHLAAWVAAQQEGNRNQAAFWAACRAVEAGDPEALDGIARAAASTGLTSREVAATIRSAQRTAGPKARAAEREAAS